ncbi:TIGR00645 family protein [Plasticicumulans sp.]|uniref:TIGR00645 family protein n=1 Tax=Plasticicumulans sp. TaxID=2307179 RepID=UPI002CDB23F0|nr:TIGR00645 family protein [Plasticicumulans sp.]MBS0601698.1 TIGR00645 family protein [Pseudomonadota bacterium]HMV40312.1 TIGR00645 family protein [Plasticicumulans sp.]HMW28236.1 TIGR00645 family protein [Plasticicumulans sp.]HMW43942.1 TIGR00645 family protein [Plasticicumulans sp.]HMX54485.1 TIGR00645 family protein [Plasticicumulans sp.]
MIERCIETLIFGSRWLLVPLYLGLAAVLVLFSARAVIEIVHVFQAFPDIGEIDLLLGVLGLIDFVLVANLLVMVILSSYEAFVSRLDVADAQERPGWLGKVDAGTVKIKLAAAIVAVSSIHLLKVFMKIDRYDDRQLWWLCGIHLVFVVSALLMAVVDKLAFAAHREH